MDNLIEDEGYYLDPRPDKDGVAVNGWMIHKHVRHEKSKRIIIIEMYRYLAIRLKQSFLKFLNSKSKMKHATDDTKKFPTTFNVLRALEGKKHNGQGKPASATDHEYITHHASVRRHRRGNSVFMERVYECVSKPNGGIKYELRYQYEQPGESKKIPGLKNPLDKLASMKEMAKQLDRRFPINPGEWFMDFSEGITLEEFERRLFRNAEMHTPDVLRRMEKRRRKLHNGAISTETSVSPLVDTENPE